MGGASGKLTHHHQSAQNLEQIPRNGSQKLSGKQPLVQIKGIKSSNRSREGGGGYGAGNTLTNRQKSSK